MGRVVEIPGGKMNYEQALEFLTNLTKFGWNPGLERIQRLMSMLGNPERSLRMIHVGGTNGKGSVGMMTARILEETGYSVGLFTSPHLHSYTERYLINHQPITEERFAEAMTRLRPFLEDMVAQGYEHPTEFEVCTALAFLYFYEEKVDFLVMEVGMGGEIDSTNVVENPLVSVITNIAMDHMDYLGDTIPSITSVKAGIIKKDGCVVTAAREPEALDIIRKRSAEMNATLLELGKDICCDIKSTSPVATFFEIRTPWGAYPDLHISLAGEYQAVNAATALGVIEFLRHKHAVPISDEQISAGLARSYWPARLEIMQQNPMLVIDVSHNYDGVCNLSNALEKIYGYHHLILVLGMLGDKERQKVVAKLAPLASTVIITKPLSPRAGDWESLADEAGKYVDDVHVIEDISQSIDKALAIADQEDMICVTGSFYMVAEAREYLLKRVAALQKDA